MIIAYNVLLDKNYIDILNKKNCMRGLEHDLYGSFSYITGGSRSIRSNETLFYK
jgi:hypothetical protein